MTKMIYENELKVGLIYKKEKNINGKIIIAVMNENYLFSPEGYNVPSLRIIRFSIDFLH